MLGATTPVRPSGLARTSLHCFTRVEASDKRIGHATRRGIAHFNGAADEAFNGEHRRHKAKCLRLDFVAIQRDVAFELQSAIQHQLEHNVRLGCKDVVVHIQIVLSKAS